MLTMLIWRRHTKQCPHRHKGRDFTKCNCPLWADGYEQGKRTLRVSLKTRDYARAIKRAATLDAPGAPPYEPFDKALAAFMQHCSDLKESTRRKYKNALVKLTDFARFARFTLLPRSLPKISMCSARAVISGP